MYMRRLICIFMVILLFSSVACAEFPTGSPEREKADQLEQTYGIRIILGNDISELPTGPYIANPVEEEEGSSLQTQNTSGSLTGKALDTLEETLAIYPAWFFSHIPMRTVFCLAGTLESRDPDFSPAGFCHPEDGCVYLFLDVCRITPSNIHHEIWHGAESGTNTAFYDWKEYNPEGFAYTGNYTDYSGFDPEWFYREYSVTTDREDRATLYEAYFTEPEEYWEGHPHLRKKLNRMLLFLKGAFGWKR